MPDYKVNQAATANGWTVGDNANDGLATTTPKLTWVNVHALIADSDTIEFNSDGSTDYVPPGMNSPVSFAEVLTATYSAGVYVFPQFSYTVATGVFQSLPAVSNSFISQTQLDTSNGGPVLNPTTTQIGNALSDMGITTAQGLYYNGTDDPDTAATNYYSVASGVVAEVQTGGTTIIANTGIRQSIRG